MQSDDCGDATCPECGGPLDPFDQLLSGFSEVADGHELSDVSRAAAIILGDALAHVPAETRAKLRRQVNALITGTTKQVVIQNRDA